MSNIVQLIKHQPQAKKMNEGFVLLFRGIKKQPWYKNSEYKAVFIHLLLNASHKPEKVNFHGCNVNLLPGQLSTSYEQLARDLNLTKALVQRAIKKFKNLNQISTLNFKEYTVIMISNWSDFQQKSDTAIDTAIDTLKPYIKHSPQLSCDTAIDTGSDTQNNNTLSKDRVKDTCPEQAQDHQISMTNIFLPLNKKNTKHQISESDFSEYQELYPGVDITRQFKLMYVWFRDNPKRKKTKAGVRSFITRWLGQEQNKGNSSVSKTLDPQDTSWGDGLELTI